MTAAGIDTDEIVIAPDAAWVSDHFPGHPLVPAAVLLTEVARVLQERQGAPAALHFERVRFMAPVVPGQALRIETRVAGTRMRFEILCGNDVAVRGTARLED